MKHLETVLRVKAAVGIETASCESCVYLDDVSDGAEYGPPVYHCSKSGRSHVSLLCTFPFTSDQTCWVPHFWKSKFAEMIKTGSDEEVDELSRKFRKAMEEAKK